MSSLRLKIGLDYHGVINRHLAYFADFCARARARGHRIYVITGGPLVLVRKYLQQAGVGYDFVFAVSDYYQALGRVEQTVDGRLEVPRYLWNIAKADFCRRSGVNFHIDDSEEYLHWFSTAFCLYRAEDNSCYLSPGLKLDFSEPPAVVLNQIEQIAARLNCR